MGFSSGTFPRIVSIILLSAITKLCLLAFMLLSSGTVKKQNRTDLPPLSSEKETLLTLRTANESLRNALSPWESYATSGP